ncbi:hypothetical protein ABT237_22135 [Streptomyces sp. NPDC001581]|uniref:hypothetical protein n=1 Tax=Streptomyces sp. NPDC001581 TaxID=3154386 RepID=UPI00333318E9
MGHPNAHGRSQGDSHTRCGQNRSDFTPLRPETEIAYNQGYDWGYAVRDQAHEYREWVRANGHLIFTDDLCPAMKDMGVLGMSLPETVGLPEPTRTSITTIVGGDDDSDSDSEAEARIREAWLNGCPDSAWDGKGEPRNGKNASRSH